MKNRAIVKQIIKTVLPVFVILFAIAYAIVMKNGKERKASLLIDGKALASYSAYYPVRVDPNGNLYMNPVLFMKAVDYFSEQPESRAAGELVYIGQANNIALQLNDDARSRYSTLLQNPAYVQYKINAQSDPLKHYKNIVDGIGQTLARTGFEIVLHDTRNPLKSIVAIQNPITGRRVGDSTTNFGYELIKSYAVLEEEGPNYVSYVLLTKDGRKVKSTTIPIYEEKNLIGFICINIDISQLDGTNKAAEDAFIRAFTGTSDSEKINEVLDNTARNLNRTDASK